MEEQPGIDWREALELVRARWVTLVVALAVGMAAAMLLAVAREPAPRYAARATVLLELRATESPFKSSGGFEDPRRALPTEMARVSSPEVREAVAAELGLALPVRAVPAGDGDMFSIEAVAADPGVAAATANAYADAYVVHRRQRLLHAYQAARAALEAQLDEVVTELAEISAAIAEEEGEEGAEAALLIQLRTALGQQAALLSQRIVQYEVDARVETGGTQVFSRAAPPSSPFNQGNPGRAGIFGGAAGLVLGLIVVAARELVADIVRTGRQARATSGLPVLADLTGRAVSSLVFGRPWAEASDDADRYRALRTVLLTRHHGRPAHLVQVCAVAASSIRSATVAVNLAAAFARSGRSVAVVEADVLGRHLLQILDADQHRAGPGLAEALLTGAPVQAVSVPIRGAEGIDLVAPGELPPSVDPVDLLAGRSAIDACADLTSRYDVVLVHAPPVAAVGSALATAGLAGDLLLVVEVGSTRRGELQRTVERFGSVGIHPLGLVLHRTPERGPGRAGPTPPPPLSRPSTREPMPPRRAPARKPRGAVAR